jgi:hypothetical protein
VARRTARVSCVQLAKTAENLDLGCRKLSLEEFRMPSMPCKRSVYAAAVQDRLGIQPGG